MQPEDRLREIIAGFRYDPLGFVRFAFPWGEGQLAEHDGPDVWQEEFLRDWGRALRRADDGGEVAQFAVSSGHGIGKSALISWCVLFFLATRPYCRIRVTANTEVQLKSTTWAEVRKWLDLFIAKHWFTYTKTKLYANDDEETWFAQAIAWSAENPQAFAGIHAEGAGVLYLFDEGSRVDNAIWEVSEGALTDRGCSWLVFGNPTEPTGRFRECFRDFAHRWNTRQVDSRTGRIPNQQKIQQWLEDYGEDSDFFRVRVRGEFPRQAAHQLIPEDIIRHAQLREDAAPGARIMGVDVARSGKNENVVVCLDGDVMTPPMGGDLVERWSGVDTMTSADRIARCIDQCSPDAVFVDGAGVGGGVVDRLRQLGYDIIEVSAGSVAMQPQRYHNMRSEMWDKLRIAIKDRLMLPMFPELVKQLTSVQYYYDKRDRLVLESKKDMEKRGEVSPDIADALSMCFSMPVSINARTKAPLQFNYGTQA